MGNWREHSAALWLAIAGAVLAVAVAVSGCGSSGGIEATNTSTATQADVSGPVGGKLTISQWPLYVDPGKNGTIAQFEQQTGVDVHYIEEINDNAEFFGKIQPLLAKGDAGGRDLITVSDWLANKMYGLGYLEKLDKSKLPNVSKNLIPIYRHPLADPHRNFTVPWQGGMTGLIVDTSVAPDVHSICDLFNPKYEGKVDMLSELRDSVPMTLKCMGIDPDKATTKQWLAAVDKIKAAAESGQIRRFTGNDYIRDLSSGNVDLVLGWSGDAIQMQRDNPDIKFVMPKEGCMIWSTSMEIPAGSPNPAAAEAFMNYVYDPRNQAQIARWVNYVTPVKGVKQIFEKTDPALAKSKLIFPSQHYTRNCTYEPVLGGEQGRTITAAFNSVVNG